MAAIRLNRAQAGATQTPVADFLYMRLHPNRKHSVITETHTSLFGGGVVEPEKAFELFYKGKEGGKRTLRQAQGRLI